MTWYYYSY